MHFFILFCYLGKKSFLVCFFLILFYFYFSFFSFLFRLAEMGHHSSYILLTSDITTFFISISQIKVLMFRLFAAMFQNILFILSIYLRHDTTTGLLKHRMIISNDWNVEWDCITFFTKDLCTECWIWRLSSDSFTMFRIICSRIEA